ELFEKAIVGRDVGVVVEEPDLEARVDRGLGEQPQRQRKRETRSDREACVGDEDVEGSVEKCVHCRQHFAAPSRGRQARLYAHAARGRLPRLPRPPGSMSRIHSALAAIAVVAATHAAAAGEIPVPERVFFPEPETAVERFRWYGESN